MTKQACFTVALRAHELHRHGHTFYPDKQLKSWDEISWYFLFMWGMP